MVEASALPDEAAAREDSVGGGYEDGATQEPAEWGGQCVARGHAGATVDEREQGDEECPRQGVRQKHARPEFVC